MNKIKQHYVWQAYLKPWTTDDKLFCLREGTVFQTNTKAIANRRYFYKSPELDLSDLKFIEELITSQAVPFLQRIHRSWLDTLIIPFRKIKVMEEKGCDQDKLNEIRKHFENNMIEELHAQIENSSITYLEDLLKGNLDFYSIEESKFEFLLFLGFQYTRTNKIRTNLLKGLKSEPTFYSRMEKIWSIASILFSINIAQGIAARPFNLVLLTNNTEDTFIAGDQPIINTHATNIPQDTQVSQLELYYPISPRLAVLITDNMAYKNDSLELSGQQVADYNGQIAKQSVEQIYGNSKEALQMLLGSN